MAPRPYHIPRVENVNGTVAHYSARVEAYLHEDPDPMISEDAAPSQCAGAAVYTAMVEDIKSGRRVVVSGVQWFGHL